MDDRQAAHPDRGVGATSPIISVSVRGGFGWLLIGLVLAVLLAVPPLALLLSGDTMSAVLLVSMAVGYGFLVGMMVTESVTAGDQPEA